MTTEPEIDLQTAVEALTRNWSDVLSPKESGTGKYQPIDYPPLLDMLAEAKSSSLGKTGAGRSPDAERNILNLAAFSLWEHIDGSTRAWIRELSKSPAPHELKAAVTHLTGLMKAAHASHQIKPERYGHMVAMVKRWKEQIWELFDPPTVKELKGKCPNCDEFDYFNLEGGKTTALIAYYWKGLQPEAKCQRCGERWEGESQLLSLGRVINADKVDEDELREMGVI